MHPKMIVPHNAGWKSAYADEAERLARAFGGEAVALHHMGGTSISGLLAKPIIDILAVVGDFDREAEWSARIGQFGYDVRGEYGIAGRRYFSRKLACEDVHGFHVHVYAEGSPHIARHLALRDYLRLHPDMVRDYSELKRSIADDAGRLPPDYQKRKSAFVARMERAAIGHFGMCGA